MILHHWDKYRDLGLLLLRLGLGFMMMYTHGYDKLVGGVEKWEKLGGAMGSLGIDFMPAFWGFMAAFSEFFGGLLLMIGLFTRPAAMLLAFTMLVAAIRHMVDPGLEPDASLLKAASHPLELLCVFLGMIFIGPGNYSLDAKLRRRSDQ